MAIGARSIWEPAVIGLIGGFFGAWWSNNDYWHLSRSERIRVWRATRTGQPTGATALGAIAAQLISESSGG